MIIVYVIVQNLIEVRTSTYKYKQVCMYIHIYIYKHLQNMYIVLSVAASYRQEEHYVCRHENCRREAYRLVAFASEDELWMHELKARKL